MIGVILAAGVGSRLRPMTNSKPKCLVTSAGKPILQYQLDAYKEAGIKEIVIVAGYEGKAIKEYLKHNNDFTIHIVGNEIYEDTNNMYSLYLARDYIDGKAFILNNADLTIESDLLDKMLTDKREDLIAVDVGLFNDESMKVSVNAKNKIIDISKGISKENSYGCSIDFYKFSSESSSIFISKINSIIESGNLKDWTEVAMQKLFQSQELDFEVFDIDGMKWVEIDNYDDLALSDLIFSQTDKKMIDYSTYCFDLDGTIYVGNEPILGAIETINRLSDLGKSIYYISNNSSKNKIDYCNKLKNMGIQVVESQIILSSDAVIEYLKVNNIKKVFVLGTNSFKKSILDSGIDLCTYKPNFVVVGYDTELTYDKLIDACRLINDGVDYIATHSDLVCPSENGPIPDIGMLTKILTETTGKEPFKIFGKPNVEIIDSIIRKEKLNKNDVVMIGDRIYTDIMLANNSGIDSILVLSGDTQREEIERNPKFPTYVVNRIDSIMI